MFLQRLGQRIRDGDGRGWLILAVLLLMLSSIRFAYYAARFAEPLDRLRMGAWW